MDELGIEDLNVPAQYHPNEQSYPLKTILNSFVHYIVFYLPIWNLEREGSDYVFRLYSENNKRKGHDYHIRLNDFFKLAIRIADDDILISNYLYRRIVRLLKQAIKGQTTFDQEFLERVARLTRDALALGNKLGKKKAIELPGDDYVDICEGALRDGSEWDLIYDYSGTQNCADLICSFGISWQIGPFTPRKEEIGGAMTYCLGIERIDFQDQSPPQSIRVVPFDSFLRMFQELHSRCRGASRNAN